MAGIFVKDTDEIVINLFQATDKDGKNYFEVDKAKLEDLLANMGVSYEIQSYKVVFRKPCFKDMVEINSDMVSMSGVSNFKVNFLANRLKQMAALIKAWDFKDDEGDLIPAIADNVDKLDPLVANLIAGELDMQINTFAI